jgi:hypothetical protein
LEACENEKLQTLELDRGRAHLEGIMGYIMNQASTMCGNHPQCVEICTVYDINSQLLVGT